jgi:hypothetical protein
MFRRKLFVYGLVLFSIPTLTVIVKADHDDLLNKIIKVQSDRSAIYDNGHFKWIMKENVDAKLQERHFEYWARNGTYFRFDTELRIDQQISGNSESVVVRPEGYVKLLRDASKGDTVVGDFGPADIGLSKIRLQYVLEQENKVAAEPLQNWIKRLRNPGGVSSNVDVKKQPDENLKVSFSSDLPVGKRQFEAILSPQDFRVISWRYKFQGAEGNEFAEQVTDLEYQEGTKHVPVSLLEAVHSHNGDSTMRCNLVSYDFVPAAIEVFAIATGSVDGSPSTSPVWIRRVSVMSIGAALIAGYLWFRKRK